MPPSVCFTPAVTPSEPFAAWPAGQLSVLSAPSVQSDPASADSNEENTLVVPEPSARWKDLTAVLGSDAPGLSALISGASQVLTVPWKMPARVLADKLRLLRPLTLKMIAMPPAVTGNMSALPLHRWSAVACSSGFIVTSEPA